MMVYIVCFVTEVGAEDDVRKVNKWQDKISSRFDSLVAFASTELDKRRRSTEGASPRADVLSCNTSPDSGIGREMPAPVPAPPPEPRAASPVKGDASPAAKLTRSAIKAVRASEEGSNSPIPATVEVKATEAISDEEDELLECGPPRTPSPSIPSVTRLGPHTPPYSPATQDGPYSPNEKQPAVEGKPPTPEPTTSNNSSEKSAAVSPSNRSHAEEQHFKKKFFHGKEQWNNSSWQDSRTSSPPTCVPNSNSTQPSVISGGSQLPGKFRPKGKDWNWHQTHQSKDSQHSEQHSTSTSSSHHASGSHYHNRQSSYQQSSTSSSSSSYHSSKHRYNNRSHHHQGKRPRLLENMHSHSYHLPPPHLLNTSVPPPSYGGGGNNQPYYHYQSQQRGKSSGKWGDERRSQ